MNSQSPKLTVENENKLRISIGASLVAIVLYSYPYPENPKEPWLIIRFITQNIIAFVAAYTFTRLNFKNLFKVLIHKIDTTIVKNENEKFCTILGILSLVSGLIFLLAKETNYALPIFSFYVFSLLLTFLSYIEGFEFSKKIYNIKSFKILTGLITSFVIYVSTSNGFAAINNIYGVDPTYFKFGITLATLINVCIIITKISYITIVPSFILSTISLIYTHKELWSFTRTVMAWSFLFLSLISLLLNFLLSNEEKRNLIIEKYSYELDMNSNHHCQNSILNESESKKPVIFLGPNSDIVLFKNNNELYEIIKCNPI